MINDFDINLEDFIPIYPDSDEPNIQAQLTMKKEFQELASSMREELPVGGGLYKIQKLYVRWMLAYDRSFNISETGVGKSGMIISLREALKKQNGNIKHCYVLQKPTTVESFKQQILCKFTNGDYETDIVKRAKNDTSRKTAITNSIKKWYSVMTYGDFASEIIKGNYTDEQIIEKYSGCLFAVDEAHNLRNKGKKGSDRSLSVVYDAIKRVFMLVKRSKIAIFSATPMINGVKDFARVINLALPPDRQLPENWDYSQITLKQLEPYLRNHVYYSRSLDTGATPIYMGVHLNDSNGNIKQYTISVPDPDSESDSPVGLMNQPENPMIDKSIQSQIIIYPTYMGDIQEDAYIRFGGITPNKDSSIEPGEDDDDEDEKPKISGLYESARKISAFVFPDANYTGEGKYTPTYGGTFHRTKKDSAHKGINLWFTSPSVNNYIPSKEFISYISDYETLKRFSGKYAEIVRIETTEPGCSFAYNDMVSGGGSIVLGACIEAYTYSGPGSMKGMKFERFNEKGSIFMKSGLGSKMSGCDTSGSGITRQVRPGFTKRPRYAILTSETPDNVFASVLEVAASPENIDGEYIKFIIGSEVARDGINIFHCLRGHLVNAGWHPAGMHQALSRFMRSVSHIDLLKRLQAQYIAEGRDPSEARIDVKIYKHAAIPRNTLYPSVDVQIYEFAERKSIPISRIMRMLKQIDMGCHINRARNVRAYDPANPESHDGSETCDYDVCDYKCITEAPNPMDIDFETYDILYSSEVVLSCVESIIKILKERESITFNELYTMWSNTGIYRKKYIYMAVDQILLNKYKLLDRYGYGCYVYTNGHNIYTQRDFPVNSSVVADNQEITTYGDKVVGITYTSLEETNVDIQLENYQEVIDQIKAIPDTSPESMQEFADLIKQLSNELQIIVLEMALVDFMNGVDLPYVSLTYSKFSMYVSYVYEPFQDILNTQILLSKNKTVMNNQKISNEGMTRTKIKFHGSPPAGTLLPDGSEVEPVIIHTLNSASTGMTTYNTVAKFRNAAGAIRIYKRSFRSKEFRNANNYELPAYNEIVQERIRQISAPFEKMNIFGTILSDGIFRIRKKNTEDKVSNSSKFRGSNCLTSKIQELITMIVENDIPMPISVSSIQVQGATDVSVYNTLLRELNGQNDKLDTYTPEQRFTMYRWVSAKLSKQSICNWIKQYFIENNMMLITN
jgi:hypothetical protein